MIANLKRIAVCLAAGISALWLILSPDNSVEGQSYQEFGNTTRLVSNSNISLNVLGVSRAGCDQCHYEEAEAWMKTAHYSSTDKLLRFRGNTQKYANALGILPEELMTTSLCADCHGTKSTAHGRVEVVSGVSCESCHGAAGGDGGWLNRHQSYHPDRSVSRTEETEAHRFARQTDCDAAGMVRPSDIAGLTRKCLSCHLISNETLVAAGHKAFSNFEFNSWTAGEVRHNFFLDRDKNQAAPTLWLERSGGTAAQRKRLKYIVGALVSLEVALRKRAELTDPTVIPQVAGFAAVAYGKLAQINAVEGTPETQAAAAFFIPMLGTLFAPHETDRQTYSQAADRIAALTTQFLDQNNVDRLESIDSVLSLTPPHYSQQFKDRANP